jgi:two-component system, OmpR family, sensor kinase
VAREHPQLLSTLQRLFDAPVADLQLALTHSANAIAEALGADKVDAFLYDELRDSLAAVGTSTQPLSDLQKRLGLDVLPLSNGGRVVHVFRTGEIFRSGNLVDDPEELRGVKEGLKILSKIGVPLEVGGQRRGMVMIASLKPDYFTAADEAFAISIVRWVGGVAHRAELIEDIERNAVERGRRDTAEELVTVLAHDLRNYLSPVASRLYILRKRAEADGRADDLDDIGAALRGVSNTTSLISDLLDVARIDRGLFAVDLEPVDLNMLVDESATLLSTAEHEVVVSASERIVAWADAKRLRQCLDNLLINAINYSPRGAPVHLLISLKRRDGELWAQVEIRDEGPGVPQELLPQIFDRFQTHRKKAGGLGLGLYLAKQIAIAHGGDVLAEQNPGRGARFVVRVRAIS